MARSPEHCCHYVYTSVGSADRKTGIPHFETKWKVEQHIRQIGLPTTILRPVSFMENFGTYFPPSKEGVLAVPVRLSTKFQMIALKDIGEFGAAAFLNPNKFIGQAIFGGSTRSAMQWTFRLSAGGTGFRSPHLPI